MCVAGGEVGVSLFGDVACVREHPAVCGCGGASTAGGHGVPGTQQLPEQINLHLVRLVIALYLVRLIQDQDIPVHTPELCCGWARGPQVLGCVRTRGAWDAWGGEVDAGGW